MPFFHSLTSMSTRCSDLRNWTRRCHRQSVDQAITDKNDHSLMEKWSNGFLTHLGLMVPKIPNFFMVYQAPTSFTIGPSFIEIKVDWICNVISKMKKESLDPVEPTQKAADALLDHVVTVSEHTLCPRTNSWYMGAKCSWQAARTLDLSG